MGIIENCVKLIFTDNFKPHDFELLEELLYEYIHFKYKGYYQEMEPIEYFLESLCENEEMKDWHDIFNYRYYGPIEKIMKNKDRVIIDYEDTGEGADIGIARVVIAIPKEDKKDFVDFLKKLNFKYEINPDIYKEKDKYEDQLKECYDNIMDKRNEEEYYRRHRYI